MGEKPVGEISPDMGIPNAVRDAIHGCRTATGVIAGNGIPQEAPDKAAAAGHRAFPTYAGTAPVPPNPHTADAGRLFPSPDAIPRRISIPSAISPGREPFRYRIGLKAAAVGHKGGTVPCVGHAVDGLPSACPIHAAGSMAEAHRPNSPWTAAAPQTEPIPELPDADRDLPA